VKRQEADCRALCEREGLEVVEVCQDDDRSAYSGKRRPGYERVLEVVGDGSVSVVVAWHPDRLTRSPKELETLIDTLEAAKVTVRTVQAGEYDLATPSGRMTARVVGAVARGESEHKSARLRRKHQELAEGGHNAGGGTRPFGFEADRVTINKTEAKLIREAAAEVLAGGTIRSITSRWTADGVPTSTGKPWSPTVVRNMLLSGRIAGLREHSTGTYRAVWKPIISVDDHRRLVALLADPARRQNGRAVRYLLTGFAECGECGTKLVARPRGFDPAKPKTADERRCYVCASGPGFHGCGKIRRIAAPVEALVIEGVLTRFDTPALAAAIEPTADERDDLEELRDIDARLAELAEMWAAGELDRVSWTAARKPLEAAQTAAIGRMRQQVESTAAAAYAGTGGALRERWPDLDFDQRRAVLSSVIDAVVFLPAVKGRNVFDPSKISVRWKA
jgi:DNA invertase Pin-like site-specific DNA recombinase